MNIRVNEMLFSSQKSTATWALYNTIDWYKNNTRDILELLIYGTVRTISVSRSDNYTLRTSYKDEKKENLQGLQGHCT